VLTGIGHEQDETITDLVAHTRLKTPTAVAEFLIDQYRQADDRINELSLTLFDLVTGKVKDEKDQLSRFLLLLKPAVKENLLNSSGDLRYRGMRLAGSVKQLLITESEAQTRITVHLKTRIKELFVNRKHTLEIYEKKNGYLDPFLILKRGYSVTYYKGNALKNPSQVPGGEIIETRMAEGNMKSRTL
jgi:exodeoxyribonuclease VII large subunit